MESTFTAIIFAASLFWILLTIGLVIFAIIVEWKTYEKAGEAGWKCIIPFYNMYVSTKFIFGSPWWLLLAFVPLANMAYVVLYAIYLAKSFGKSTGFAIGLIFLSPIFKAIIAFDRSYYIGPGGLMR